MPSHVYNQPLYNLKVSKVVTLIRYIEIYVKEVSASSQLIKELKKNA